MQETERTPWRSQLPWDELGLLVQIKETERFETSLKPQGPLLTVNFKITLHASLALRDNRVGNLSLILVIFRDQYDQF